MRIASAERTVTCVILPNDLQGWMPWSTPPHEHGTVHSSVGYSPPRIMPTRRRASPRGRRCSTRARGSRSSSARARSAPRDEVIEVAERLGAGVAKALLGKAVVPDDLPYVTGSIGLLGTKPSWEMMRAATRC